MANVESPLTQGRGNCVDERSFITPFFLFCLSLLVRLAFLPIANNNGTDAWARLLIAESWTQHPNQIPSPVWLPLHFWLLGIAYWVGHSEFSARLLTAILGALTILPYYGLLRRVFGSRVALWSGALFATFGFHIAYSLATSSEGPTIFFLVLGFYGWARFRLDEGALWLIPAAIGFIAASLCRYEVWVFIALVAVFTLDFSRGLVSVWQNRRAWGQALEFVGIAGAGIFGWLIFSWHKWGGPLATAKYNAWTARYLQPQHGLIHRLIAVPGALAVTLDPLVCLLALYGLLHVRAWTDPLKRTLAAVALLMLALQIYNSVASNLTMARFTLMYDWLIFPFAIEGLLMLSKFWPTLVTRPAVTGLFAFSLLWQGGVTLGAYEGPQAIAAPLASVTVTLPLDPELRNLTGWLKAHRMQNEMIVVDQYNFEAVDITRYSGISLSRALAVPESVDPRSVESQVVDFVKANRPQMLVYCPEGILGTVWSLGEGDYVDVPRLKAHLRLRWQGDRYRVYDIEYSAPGVAAFVRE